MPKDIRITVEELTSLLLSVNGVCRKCYSPKKNTKSKTRNLGTFIVTNDNDPVAMEHIEALEGLGVCGCNESLVEIRRMK